MKQSLYLALAVTASCVDPGSTDTNTNQQAVAVDPSQVSASVLQNARVRERHEPRSRSVALAAKRAAATVDTLVNFSGQFTAPGFDDAGQPRSVWPYTMVGREPSKNRSTRLHAPIIPVTVELLDANGNVGKTASGAPLRLAAGPDTVGLTLNSPVFQRFPTTAGTVQLTDGLMRAQFNQVGGRDDDRDDDRDDRGYHTVLEPSVKTGRTIQLPFGTYRFAPKPDGSCCLFVLADVNEFSNRLFPATPDDTTTVMGAAEHAGDMTPQDVTTLLFRDVYLFDGDPSQCCILGFHSFDSEPGTPANGNRDRAFVMNYASYMTDGLFGSSTDVTALSHEMSELFADPFTNNATPWWLSSDPRGGQLCQNNLETGDVIEVLSSNTVASVPIRGRTYHPQNEALLPWFAFEAPSTAHLGAYSFPDETTLTALSPAPLLPGCVAPTPLP